MRLISAALLSSLLATAAYPGDDSRAPVQLSLSLVGGADYSYVEADGDMGVFFEPLPNVINLKSPAFGLQCDLLLGRTFGAMAALGYDRRGQYIEQRTVEFKDDPFEHDFESRTIASYVTFTLALKAGRRFERQWVNVTAGIVPSFLWSDSLAWTIDGRESQTPAVSAESDFRLLLGIEYGFRHERFGVFATVDYQRGVVNIASGVDGNSRTRAIGGRLGVRYFFGARPPRQWHMSAPADRGHGLTGQPKANPAAHNQANAEREQVGAEREQADMAHDQVDALDSGGADARVEPTEEGE